MSKLSTILALALSLLLAQAMFASWVSTPTDVCPAPNGGSSGGEGVASSYSALVTISGGVVTGNTGCNDLITFNWLLSKKCNHRSTGSGSRAQQ
jgi:hypothetical protein